MLTDTKNQWLLPSFNYDLLCHFSTKAKAVTLPKLIASTILHWKKKWLKTVIWHKIKHYSVALFQAAVKHLYCFVHMYSNSKFVMCRLILWVTMNRNCAHSIPLYSLKCFFTVKGLKCWRGAHYLCCASALEKHKWCAGVQVFLSFFLSNLKLLCASKPKRHKVCAWISRFDPCC